MHLLTIPWPLIRVVVPAADALFFLVCHASQVILLMMFLLLLMSCNSSSTIFLKLNMCSCQSLVLLWSFMALLKLHRSSTVSFLCVYWQFWGIKELPFFAWRGDYCFRLTFLFKARDFHKSFLHLLFESCGGWKECWGVSPLSCMRTWMFKSFLYPQGSPQVPGLHGFCQGELWKWSGCRDFPYQS